MLMFDRKQQKSVKQFSFDRAIEPESLASPASAGRVFTTAPPGILVGQTELSSLFAVLALIPHP